MRPDLLHIEYRYLCCCTLSLALLLLLPGRGIAEQIFGSSFISTIHPACLYAAMAVAGICALFMTALWLAVTKYKRSLRKLDDKEKLLKTIADYTYDWELWIGNNGSILFCSPACERISGYARTAFEKHPPSAGENRPSGGCSAIQVLSSNGSPTIPCVPDHRS